MSILQFFFDLEQIKMALEKYLQRVNEIFGFGVTHKVKSNITVLEITRLNVFPGNRLKKVSFYGAGWSLGLGIFS